MASLRQIVPFVLVMVVFGMLLSCRGLGLHSLMNPSDTRIIFFVEMLLALGAMLLLATQLRYYKTSTAPSEGTDDLREENYCVYLSNETKPHSISQFLSQYANVMAVYVFGGGSVALNACYIYYEAQCLPFFREERNNQSLLRASVPLTKDEFTYIDEVSRVLTSVAKIIMIIFEIPLLHHLSMVKYKTKKSFMVNVCILVIMGANLAIWLYTFLDETKLLHIFSYDYANVPDVSSLRTACLNHTNVAEIYAHSTLEHALYPFTMEFCIISVEILYHVYFLEYVEGPRIVALGNQPSRYDVMIDKVNQLCRNPQVCLVPSSLEAVSGDNDDQEVWGVVSGEEVQDGDDDVNDENRPLLNPVARQRFRPRYQSGAADADPDNVAMDIIVPGNPATQPTKSRLAKIWSFLISFNSPVTALILGIIEAILIKLFLLHEELVKEGSGYITEEDLHYKCAIPLIAFCILCDGVPLVTVTSHCYHVLSKFPHRRATKPQIKNSIILALAGISILTSFKVIVSFIKLRHVSMTDEFWLHSLTLIEALLFWPQYFLQSMVIYLGLSRLSDASHVQYGTLQGALSYMAMNNFIHWGISSFLETEYLTHRMELHKDVELWDTLVFLLTPTFIFFYFICTFMIIEVKAKLLESEVPNKKWRFNLRMANWRY